MVPCSSCGKHLGESAGTPSSASISGGIMGDEQIDTYFLCPSCGVYTVEVCDDRFCGEETVTRRGPLSKKAGDARVALIQRCPEPWDKKCRCAAHREYFGESLD
jgi:hypothetical protein